MFLQKLRPFWLVHDAEFDFDADKIEESLVSAYVRKSLIHRKRNISKLIQEMLNLSGDPNGIPVTDLVSICTAFRA